MERMENYLWARYHPLLVPIRGLYEAYSVSEMGYDSVEDVQTEIRKREKELEKDFGFSIKMLYGGQSEHWCPFLEHKDEEWSCLINEYKPDTCRVYLCDGDEQYKDIRLRNGQSWPPDQTVLVLPTYAEFVEEYEEELKLEEQMESLEAPE